MIPVNSYGFVKLKPYTKHFNFSLKIISITVFSIVIWAVSKLKFHCETSSCYVAPFGFKLTTLVPLPPEY